MEQEKITLANGVRILLERLPDVRTASLGIFAANGSRHEPDALAGISHCIEHMVFKGTGRRTAAAIAEELDSMGGNFNAYTTKELTCFYGTCLSRHVERTADLLADMVLNPCMRDADLALERGVINEEIDMYEDTPEDLVCEILAQEAFAGCPIGRPILGSKETLAALHGADLTAYMREKYTGENLIIALAGSFDDAAVEHLKALFAAVPRGTVNGSAATVYHPVRTLRKKPIEQAHLLLAYPGISSRDPDRFTQRLLNSIFGDGMSSRLFQRVREKEGLCYSVYSFPSSASDGGVYEIYTATSREMQNAALTAIQEEIDRLLQDGVTQEELDRAREQTEAGLLISLEGTGARMSQLAKTELLFGRLPDLDSVLAHYAAVTREDMLAFARKVFVPEGRSFAAVGNLLAENEYHL